VKNTPLSKFSPVVADLRAMISDQSGSQLDIVQVLRKALFEASHVESFFGHKHVVGIHDEYVVHVPILLQPSQSGRPVIGEIVP
jgi:hypothetical protein